MSLGKFIYLFIYLFTLLIKFIFFFLKWCSKIKTNLVTTKPFRIFYIYNWKNTKIINNQLIFSNKEIKKKCKFMF